jgi:hypothetical protein
MSTTKKAAPVQKISRKEQWKINSLNRRRAVIAEGGRLLPVLLESDYSEQLDTIIVLRKKANPRINMTAWVKLMIEADLKLLQRRRAGAKGVRST